MWASTWAAALLLSSTTAATKNVILDCARASNATNALVAPAAPACGWEDYERFLASAGIQAAALNYKPSEITDCLTTALTIVEALRLTLGDEEYERRTEPVTVEMIGWAFHWMPRPEVEGTSNTVFVHPWDAELQRTTKLFWGTHIAHALRALLPLVKGFDVIGYGPEAPRVEQTPMSADSWLTLELHPGVYDSMSEPQPTVSLLENSGMHDDLWPSDGGCISDKGDFARWTQRELDARMASGRTDGVGLGCFWRATVELLRDSGRLVFATSYSSMEHLSAIANVEGIGAEVVFAHANGFCEEGAKAMEMELLRPPGNPLAESLRDPTPRAWGRKEALYATTTAVWRHRIELGGYEATPRMSRNRYVLAFRGPKHRDHLLGDASHQLGRRAGTMSYAEYEKLWHERNRASAITGRLQAQALAAAALPSMPPRQRAILEAVPWLKPGYAHERPPDDGAEGAGAGGGAGAGTGAGTGGGGASSDVSSAGAGATSDAEDGGVGLVVGTT